MGVGVGGPGGPPTPTPIFFRGRGGTRPPINIDPTHVPPWVSSEVGSSPPVGAILLQSAVVVAPAPKFCNPTAPDQLIGCAMGMGGPLLNSMVVEGDKTPLIHFSFCFSIFYFQFFYFTFGAVRLLSTVNEGVWVRENG